MYNIEIHDSSEYLQKRWRELMTFCKYFGHKKVFYLDCHAIKVHDTPDRGGHVSRSNALLHSVDKIVKSATCSDHHANAVSLLCNNNYNKRLFGKNIKYNINILHR